MNREFLINIVFLVIINVLIKPFFIFGIDRSVQNFVGEREYGIYFSLLSFTIMFQIINDLGIQNFNSREISQNRDLLDKYFSNILVLKIFLALVYCLSLGAMAYIFGYEMSVYPLIFSLAINQILFSLLNYLRSNVAGLGYYRTNSILTVLDKLLMIVVCSVLLWVEPFRSHFNIAWFVHAQNMTLLVTCSVAFFIVFKKITVFQLSFDKAFLMSILRGALPYALAIFLMTIYTRTDVVMLERLLPDGDRQAGIYASAYRLLDAANMLGFLFSGLLLPMFSRILKEEKPISPLLRFSFQMILVASVSLAMGVWFHRSEIMHLLYAEATDYSGDVLGYLMFSFVAISGTYIYSTLLGANGSVSRMNTVFILAIGINIGLNFLLIPTHKAMGAALSTLITQFFVLIGVILLAKKELILRGDTLWVSKLVLFVISSGFIHFIFKINNYLSHWVMQLSVSLFLCGVIALILGFFNYKKLEIFK